jgi:uncharacterized protein (DUF433 family)
MGEPLITIDSEIMGGTPVFYGTRVPVQTLIDYLEAGDSIDRFLDHFDTVRKVQVLRFLETAAAHMIAEAHENIA